MVFFCYRCHKTIYNVSPTYHNLSCKVPFRNRNNHNNNNLTRNRFNHSRFNNDHNHRSNRYNYNSRFNNNHSNRYNYNRYRNSNNNNSIDNSSNHEGNNTNNNLDSWNNESIDRFNRNIERIRPNNNDNNNNTNNEIPDEILQSVIEVMIARIERRNNERDNNDNSEEIEIEDISGSDNENALDEDVINTFPKAIIDNIEKLKEKNCSICLEDFKKGEEQMTIPCFHMFHSNCISHWFELNNCCPVCKHNCNCQNSNIYKLK